MVVGRYGQEAQQIIDNFNKHGFEFSSYDAKLRRSNYEMRTFLYAFICNLHQDTGGVQLHLFETLQTLLTVQSTVELKNWAREAATNQKHVQCYMVIILNNKKFLQNWFAIEIENNICKIVGEGWHQKGKPKNKRTPFQFTAEEIKLIDEKLKKYRRMDQDSIKVKINTCFNFTTKCNQFLNLQFPNTDYSITLRGDTPKTECLVVVPTPLKSTTKINAECEEFIDFFEQQLEEYGDSAQISQYNKVSDGDYHLTALALTDGTVEYSFSKFHPVQTIIHGLSNLKKGDGCKSWKIKIVDEVTVKT